MRSEVKIVIACLAVAGLAGCAPVDPGFGESLKYDMAAQTIDPDPVYPENGAKPGDNGQKAAKASENYRKGTTKPVQSIGTSSGTSGGGSGGNGSSAGGASNPGTP